MTTSLPVKQFCSTSMRMCTVTGGINFDAKLRRESTSLVDLFYGHISGMDALARALRNAAQMLEVRLHLLLPLTSLNLMSINFPSMTLTTLVK